MPNSEDRRTSFRSSPRTVADLEPAHQTNSGEMVSVRPRTHEFTHSRAGAIHKKTVVMESSADRSQLKGLLRVTLENVTGVSSDSVERHHDLLLSSPSQNPTMCVDFECQDLESSVRQ